jgi:molybdenum cofactor cytidylyltransferase
MRRVGALILAAGGSTRFGEPKQFLEFEGETLIRRTANVAQSAGCQPIVVVAGDAIDAIRDEAGDCEVIQNQKWQRGIGSSIRLGVVQLRNRVDAVVILACDQPLVSAEIVRRLIAQPAPIAASSYSGILGIPACFNTRYFDALSTLPDDAGAKSLIEMHLADVAVVSFPDGAIDIDTRADYDAIRSAG